MVSLLLALLIIVLAVQVKLIWIQTGNEFVKSKSHEKKYSGSSVISFVYVMVLSLLVPSFSTRRKI